MYLIENDAIYLTRGDDAVLGIALTGADGTAYALEDGDVLTLTVRALPSAESEILLQLSGEPGGDEIVLRHEDTAGIEPGGYSADVQLTTAVGLRYTVWPQLEGSARTRVRNWRNFNLMPEVTEL